MSAQVFDVAVIGAGVVGAAVARELSMYRLSCALIEGAGDVGASTSKANTAILHTGFDAEPGTLEARLLPRGHDRLKAFADEAGIAVEPTGAIMVAWTTEEVDQLDSVVQKAHQNGYTRIRRLSQQETYSKEPNLGPGALGGLEIPDEGIICPFTTPLAFATQAVLNGACFMRNTPVEGVSKSPDNAYVLSSGTTDIAARYVVNCAGLNSDKVDRFFGHQSFTVTPRRGQLVVFDKLSRSLVNHIVLPVPSKKTKGVLVAPTVFGNVLLGPTAEDIEDRTGTQTTRTGLDQLWDKGAHIVPALLQEEITATYAGLRAATEHRDYQIRSYPDERYVCVGGIRSTGLSGSMAIAEYVAELLFEADLERERKPDHKAVRMPAMGEASRRAYQDDAAIQRRPDYGRIVCHCERVSLGEIVDACESPIPARDLDGLRRRTRAQLGRCQTFYCGARLVSLLAEHSGASVDQILDMDKQ